MKFTITGRNEGSDHTWDEPYDKPEVTDQASAQKWAEGIIEFFNGSLRPGESPRELVGVKVQEGTEGSRKDHKWSKQNLTTQRDNRGALYDSMRCSECGITGRRYGMDLLVLDQKYRRAKVYLRCDDAKRHIAHQKKKSRGR